MRRARRPSPSRRQGDVDPNPNFNPNPNPTLTLTLASAKLIEELVGHRERRDKGKKKGGWFGGDAEEEEVPDG